MSEAPAIEVAILALPETSASMVYLVHDLLMCAGRDWAMVHTGQPGPQHFHPRVVAAEAGAFVASNDVTIVPHASFDAIEPPAIVCIPDLAIHPDGSIRGQYRREVRWLRRCHEGGALLASACSGSMLLAEAGLLDGGDATTHWAYAAAMQRDYPRVRVQPRSILIASGTGERVVMAGGGTSVLDLTLYLIARYAGPEAAMQVARLQLIDWHSVGQQPFARLAQTRQVEDATIRECQVWIARNYACASPVTAMTAHSGLHERAFTRRFKRATGLAPLDYVHTLRLEEAKQMLESGDATVEAIAEEVGYEDAAFFSQLFRRKVGLTPVQYRKRFGTLRQGLASMVAISGASRNHAS